jgi:hypothetical protein
VAAGILFLSGCKKDDGVSDSDRMRAAQQNVAESLASQGAKAEEKTFPQGKAWSVSLRGLTVTDEMLSEVKKLGNITELDLSKSTVTDDQLGVVTSVGLTPLLLKLDLSNTAITDAGLEKLDNLRLLTQMDLSGTKVTPAAVERFKEKRRTDSRIPGLFRNPTIRLK